MFRSCCKPWLRLVLQQRWLKFINVKLREGVNQSRGGPHGLD